ncbi:hypothetical protein EV177_004056 [Coemansia sp. RSA 1804]|nr:hypothetical protein EV177_004056 [Coemansia sp. RSA 1804]
MSKGLGNYWKTIVHDHTPRYLKLLEAHSKGAHSLRRKFATSVWSQAIHRYATQGEVEEAVDLFRRIIKLGGYPVSQAPASLLISLTKTSLPLPVLPKDWQGAPRKVFNMEPAYPPQGTSSADLFIVPANVAERARIVAEIGLAMLYSMLRRELWPTTYFYCVLFSVLGNACMDSELKHIFSRVMPFAIRAMPAKFRIRPELMSSPTVWTMAIKAAVNCGCRPLAEHWFKEYRMSAMSIFRDDASAYSRFAFHGQPQYVRLYDLSRPYYQIFPKKWHWDQRGDTSTFVYDLQEVESQLELDRLRALDKLPLGYAESATMLNIYTLVNEHRDMHSAEILAEEIQSLHIDKCVPKASKPRGHSSLAYCWRMMVVGYINELRQASVLPMSDGHETYTIRRLERRLSYWFKQWRDAFEMVTINSNERKSDIFILSNEELSTAERISRGIDN